MRDLDVIDRVMMFMVIQKDPLGKWGLAERCLYFVHFSGREIAQNQIKLEIHIHLAR